MLKHYLTLALKVLWRRKFFTFISLFGISFTLLVLTVITAMFDHAFGPGAPEPRLNRTLFADHAVMYGPHSQWSWRAPGFKLFDKYARNLPGVERLSIYQEEKTVESFVDGRKIRSALKRTDDEFWRILDFTFLEGGPFGTDDVNQARFVAVINATTRQRFFDGQTCDRPDAGSRRPALQSRRRRRRRVGAARCTLRGHLGAVHDREDRRLQARGHGRLACDGAGDGQGGDGDDSRRVQLAPAPGRTARSQGVPGDRRTVRDQARGLRTGDADHLAEETRSAQVSRFIGALVGLGLLFVLIPTVNLVNINISRIMERASEIGVRKAFGAPARTLVGQFLVENILLTLVGAAVGFGLSMVALRVIQQSGIVSYGHFTLNPRVFAWGVILAIAFGLISGVYPAWRMSRLNPVDALKGGVSR